MSTKHSGEIHRKAKLRDNLKDAEIYFSEFGWNRLTKDLSSKGPKAQVFLGFFCYQNIVNTPLSFPRRRESRIK